MSVIGEIWNHAWAFVAVLTVVVFFHELGHYLVARWNGVRVQVFSVGFGPELFGWTDAHGTRWKFAIIPLGGYVKMFGDTNPASAPGDGTKPAFTPEESRMAFVTQHWARRAAIVSAGPIANFILAVVLLAGLFASVGQQTTPPEIVEVMPQSAAERAGLEPGDVVRAIDGQPIERFEEMAAIVVQNPGVALNFSLARGGAEIILIVTPDATDIEDALGAVHTIGRIGVKGGAIAYVRQDFLTAIALGFERTVFFSGETLKAVGQMIAGTRTTDELSGPIGIAQLSGQVAQQGLPALIFLMAVLSINLGLINLFPVPLLDGGHLFLYAIEAVRGKPLGPGTLEVIFRIGLGLIVLLIGFVLWNDFKKLGIVNFLSGIF